MTEEEYQQKYVKQLEDTCKRRLDLINYYHELLLVYLIEIQKANKGIRRLKRKLDKCLEQKAEAEHKKPNPNITPPKYDIVE